MKTVELIEKRIKSKTPPFFKKLRNWSIIVGAIAGTLSTFPITWPAWVTSFFTLVTAFCTAIAGTSQLTSSESMIKK